MVNHELVKYIHSYRKQGYPPEQIIAHVVKHGHPHAEAQEASEHVEKLLKEGKEPGEQLAPASVTASPTSEEKKPVEPAIHHETHHEQPKPSFKAPAASSHHQHDKKTMKKGPFILIGVVVAIVIVLYFVQNSIGGGGEVPASDDWYTAPAQQQATGNVALLGVTVEQACEDTVSVLMNIQSTFGEALNASLIVSSNETKVLDTTLMVAPGTQEYTAQVSRQDVEGKLVIVEVNTAQPGSDSEEKLDDNTVVQQVGVLCGT